MEACPECETGKLQKKKTDYILLGQNLGSFDALICSKCDEKIFTGEALTLIEKKAKQKGLWGLSARTKIGTSGNALDVKLPKAIVDFLKLKKGQEVLIEPINEKEFRVDIVG